MCHVVYIGWIKQIFIDGNELRCRCNILKHERIDDQIDGIAKKGFRFFPSLDCESMASGLWTKVDCMMADEKTISSK